MMARKSTGQLVIRRRKDGVTFGARVRVAGERRYVTLGSSADGMTATQARDELANLLADIRRGRWTPPTPAPAVEAPLEEPTFHVLASEWVERRRHEVDARTVEHWTWALSNHLLPFFRDYRPSQITAALVERYKAAKLGERERMLAEIERWRRADPVKRGRMPARPLSNASVNKTLKTLAQVLDDAVEFEWLGSNPARGKRRRLKASRPRRTWLELHEVQALLAGGGKHRALLATMILAGLRVGELSALRWRDVDLAGGKLRIEDAKTDAGERVIDVSPLLLDELKLHRADSTRTAPTDLVFGTSVGTVRNRSNVTRQILQPAIERANVELVDAGRPPLEGITNHSLRRTFASLLYEAGASPAYVMSQMGHTDPALALEIYTKVMERKRDVGERMDALVRGAQWDSSAVVTGQLGAGRGSSVVTALVSN
jgi:integrase